MHCLSPTPTHCRYGQPISAIYPARSPTAENRSAGEQAGFQLAAVVCTLAISITSGLLVGFLVNIMRGSVDAGPLNYFHDADYWEGVPDLEGANGYMGVGKQDEEAAELDVLAPPVIGTPAAGTASAAGVEEVALSEEVAEEVAEAAPAMEIKAE